MQRHERLIQILDLFSQEKPNWELEEIHTALGHSKSTLYRYLKTLTDAGLLTTFPGRGYSLGSRFVEFDYLIRVTDPLIRLAGPVLTQLAETNACVGLLCRRYSDKVLCVFQHTATTTIHSSYERGKARPIFRGAASQVILAHLSAYQLNRLYTPNAAAFSEARLGDDLAGVRQSLSAIRAVGWHATEGQVTPGVVGIAAPLFDERGDITGSYSLTLPAGNVTSEDIRTLGVTVAGAAQEISQTLKKAPAS